MTQNCLDVLATEGIAEGCWLRSRTWYFNSNNRECIRDKSLGIYLLKYLHHPELNWVVINPDIQALINLRILKNNFGMKNRRQSVRDIIL
jgi:hypothetical protein